jgi:hypothetical protein
MSQLSERIRSLGHNISLIVTGLAAGLRAIFGTGKDDTEAHRRVTEAASGREGDEPPWRHAAAARRETATGEAEQAREEAAGRPAAGTPEGATPATTAATEAVAQTATATPEDAQGSAAAATEAAARPERGPGERANPAAPQDLPGGMAPADVRRGIAQESRRTGDSQGVPERASEPPPRVASPGHGQVGDLRNRVDQVVNDQARIAQQLVHLSDQARAAWRAAQEVTRQLQQVNRNALKR